MEEAVEIMQEVAGTMQQAAGTMQEAAGTMQQAIETAVPGTGNSANTETPVPVSPVVKEPEATIPPIEMPDDATPEATVSRLYKFAKEWLSALPEKAEEVQKAIMGFLSHSNDLEGTFKAAEALLGFTVGKVWDLASKLVEVAQEHLQREKTEPFHNIPDHVDKLIKHGDDPGALFQAMDKWQNPDKSPEVTEELRMVVAEAVARKGAHEGMDPEAIATSLALALPNSTDPDRNHARVANTIYQEVTGETPHAVGFSDPSRTDSPMQDPVQAAPAEPAMER
jgi:hypothetical protein